MPRKRITRRGKVGAGQTIAAPATTIVLSRTAFPLLIDEGATTTYSDDTVTISSTGNGAGFVVTDDAAWLTYTLDPQPDGSVLLTPTVNASALSAGPYTGTITVTDTRASNSPQTIVISLTVQALIRTIGLSPASLSLSLVDETVGGVRQFTIIGLGSPNLATPTLGAIVYGGAFTGWVTNTGIVDNGDNTWTLSLTPTAVGGTVGTGYTADIPIVSTGASNTPLTLRITLDVTSVGAAQLVLDRGLDDHPRGTVGGANPASVSVGIRSGNATPLSGPTVSAPTYSGDYTGWATATISGNTLTVATDISALVVDGSGYVQYTVSDGAASNTQTYRTYLRLGAAVTLPPLLVVAPTGVGASCDVGSNPVSQVLTVTNGGSGGLSGLGVVTAAFTTSTAWCTPTYDSVQGFVTLTFNAAALSANTYTATLRVSATLSSIPFVDIPLTLVVNAVVAGSYPQPPAEYIFPTGWAWDVVKGYPVGSVFNGVGPAGAANLARPTFSGATHQIPETYAGWAAASAAITAGTIVPGDIISIRADQVINDAQFPVIPGRVLSDNFICVQSRNIGSLPAYSYANGPDSFGVNNRGGKDAHLADMPIFQTTNLNQSTINFQQGGGGYWIEGVQFYANTGTTVTSAIMSLKGRIGTNPAHSQLAHIPSGIVIDRCRFRSSGGHQNVIEADGRYVRLTHNTFDYARRPGLTSDNYENKFCYIISTDGHFECLGNQFSALGIALLVGGSDPTITNINPSDGVVMWNRVPNVALANNGTDGDDDKNVFECKTGRRWFFGFNVATDLCGRTDQKFFGLSKSVDANGGNNFIAHSTDQMWWCNHIHGAKGVFGAAPRTVQSSSALDSERLYCMWNLVRTVWDRDHYPGLWKRNEPLKPLWGFGYGDRLFMQVNKSEGQGIQTVRVEHNTCGLVLIEPTDTYEINAFLELTNAGAGVWSNLVFDNNVCFSIPKYGPCRGDSPPSPPGGSNTVGMNNRFGAGNWNMRRNLIGVGGATWDATLAGAGYNNGYMFSTGNFVDTAVNNYGLVANHPGKGTAFGSSRDVGYDHAYLSAMTSTVLTNTGL